MSEQGASRRRRKGTSRSDSLLQVAEGVFVRACFRKPRIHLITGGAALAPDTRTQRRLESALSVCSAHLPLALLVQMALIRSSHLCESATSCVHRGQRRVIAPSDQTVTTSAARHFLILSLLFISLLLHSLSLSHFLVS